MQLGIVFPSCHNSRSLENIFPSFFPPAVPMNKFVPSTCERHTSTLDVMQQDSDRYSNVCGKNSRVFNPEEKKRTFINSVKRYPFSPGNTSFCLFQVSYSIAQYFTHLTSLSTSTVGMHRMKYLVVKTKRGKLIQRFS